MSNLRGTKRIGTYRSGQTDPHRTDLDQEGILEQHKGHAKDGRQEGRYCQRTSSSD